MISSPTFIYACYIQLTSLSSLPFRKWDIFLCLIGDIESHQEPRNHVVARDRCCHFEHLLIVFKVAAKTIKGVLRHLDEPGHVVCVDKRCRLRLRQVILILDLGTLCRFRGNARQIANDPKLARSHPCCTCKRLVLDPIRYRFCQLAPSAHTMADLPFVGCTIQCCDTKDLPIHGQSLLSITSRNGFVSTNLPSALWCLLAGYSQSWLTWAAGCSQPQYPARWACRNPRMLNEWASLQKTEFILQYSIQDSQFLVWPPKTNSIRDGRFTGGWQHIWNSRHPGRCKRGDESKRGKRNKNLNRSRGGSKNR